MAAIGVVEIAAIAAPTRGFVGAAMAAIGGVGIAAVAAPTGGFVPGSGGGRRPEPLISIRAKPLRGSGHGRDGLGLIVPGHAAESGSGLAQIASQ